MNCLDYLSPIRRGFVPGFVNFKKGCTRLTVASDKVYQLLTHGRWFSPGTPTSSTTKTGRHDIAEILLKVTLSTKSQAIKPSHIHCCVQLYVTQVSTQVNICDLKIVTSRLFYIDQIYIQYTYIVGKYKIYLYEL